MRAMAYNANGPSTDTVQEAPADSAGWPSQPVDQGGTSVPERPSPASPRTRTLGPGSIAGTLCADPELRFSNNGKALVKARVAVTERHQDRDTGRWSNGPVEFVDVTVWGGQGRSEE